MKKNNNQNYYEILHLDSTASNEDIEKAYKLTKKAFSDNSLAVYSLFDHDETKGILQKIEEAYVVLSSSDTKKKYDQEVMGVSQEESKDSQEMDVFKSEVSRDYMSMGGESEEESKTVQLELKESVYEDAPQVQKENNAANIENEEIKGLDSFVEYSGEYLKRIRESKKITISEISSSTKINPDYLSAIEDYNIQRLPPKVYLIGFLRQYAKFLGLDQKKVAEGYIRHIESNKKG